MKIDTTYRPFVPEVDPKRCRTGDPDNGGDCTACVEYRRLREKSRKRWGHK